MCNSSVPSSVSETLRGCAVSMMLLLLLLMVLVVLVEVVWTKLVLGLQMSLLFVRRVICGCNYNVVVVVWSYWLVVVWTLREVLLSLLSVD